MSKFLEAMRAGPLLADGAMGSFLFERTGRLSEPNHVYESLNLDAPDLVRQVHAAYLRAGARCLTTNTFGANRAQLLQLGEDGRLGEINRAGVRLAREAIAGFQRQSGDREPCFVLGSVGPTPGADEDDEHAAGIYREQIEALAGEGVDALLIETFTSLRHARVVLGVVSERPGAPPVIVHVAPREDGERWERDHGEYVEEMSRLGAAVVGVNCCAPWEAEAFLDAASSTPAVKEGRSLLSAMPNAGGFQRIRQRYLSRVNPEFMGRTARSLAARGARLVGGCCEVHPPHVEEMAGYLHAVTAGDRAVAFAATERLEPARDDAKKANGRFSRRLKEGKFVISVEVLPPRGTSPRSVNRKIAAVSRLAESGLADAVDITDGSRGIPLVPPGDFVAALRGRLGWTDATGDGVELIPHFTTRDLNLMGLQARLIGYHTARIHNVLFITGDPPKMSPDYPRSTAVFDLDSIAMVRYAHSFLNAGVDFGGRPLGTHPDPRTHFTIGSGVEPEALNAERELDRLRAKIDAGADYVMTQPAFRPEPLAALEPFRSEVPIIVGVMVLTSLAHAHNVAQIPGVVIPPSIYDRLGSYEQVTDQARAGIEIAAEQSRRVADSGWAGLYLMSPASARAARAVLREAGIRDGGGSA